MVRWSAAGGKLCVPEPGSRSLRNDSMSMSGPPGRSGLRRLSLLTCSYLLLTYSYLFTNISIPTDNDNDTFFSFRVNPKSVGVNHGLARRCVSGQPVVVCQCAVSEYE